MPVYFGHRITSPDAYFGWLYAGELRGCKFTNTLGNAWVTKLGIWAGKYSGSPQYRLAIHAVDGSGNPSSRVCYSALRAPTANMTDASGGASYEDVLDVVDVGPSTAAAMLTAGQVFTLDMLGTVAQLAHSQTAGSNNFYQRSGLSQPPPNPYGSASASPEGDIAIWAVCELNVAPNTPATGDMAPSGTVNETAPTFTCPYKDSNAGYGGATDCGDRLKQYRIQVRRVSDAAMFWDLTQTAASSEQAADAVSRAYGGTTLVRGTAYEWRHQQADEFNTWSGWSTWLSFTPAALGYVTLDATPTGKTEDNSPDFSGKWSHQTSLSTDRVQVRVLDQNGSVLYTGSEVTKTVAHSAAPGTAFTITWAESGLTVPLAWGTNYQYQIRGRDTNSVWSDWSAARTFNTNAVPATPSSLTPASGVHTSRPLLRCLASDADDTSGTGLAVTVRIKSQENWDNPTFASNLTGWSEEFKDTGWTYTPTRDASVYKDAAGSLKLAISACPGTTNKKLRYGSDDYLNVVAGESYSWQAWARKSHATDIDVRIAVDWYTSGGSLVSTSSGTDITDTIDTWFQTTLTATAPATAARAHVSVEVVNNVTSLGASRDVYFDQVEQVGWQVRSHKAMALVAGQWEYQTTNGADDVPGYAAYRWDAFSYDGTIYSGEGATAILAAKSSEALFTYAAGPVITVTEPDDPETVTTATFTVTWTVDSGGPQAKYRVIWYADGTSTIVYDSGWVVSASTSHAVPSGSYRNNTNYDVVVMVENDLTAQGTSAVMNVAVAYTPASIVQNVTAITTRAGQDPWDASILVSWNQTAYGSEFVRYTVRRRSGGAVDAAEIVAARLTSPSSINWRDDHPASGIEYTYTVTQTILAGVDELESADVEVTATVTLGGVELVAVDDTTRRLPLQVVEARGHQHKRAEFVFVPESDDAPTTIRAASAYWETRLSALLRTDSYATYQQRLAQFEAIAAAGGTYSYRDERGVKRFVTVEPQSVDDQRLHRAMVALALRETDWTEVAA